jgi:hypothetical protein
MAPGNKTTQRYFANHAHLRSVKSFEMVIKKNLILQELELYSMYSMYEMNGCFYLHQYFGTQLSTRVEKV